MNTVKRRMIVNGKSFPLIEKAGYIKADLGGLFGWTAVWVSTKDEIADQPPTETPMWILYQRIQKALAEGSFGAPTGSR